jgi:hypothetical protein
MYCFRKIVMHDSLPFPVATWQQEKAEKVVI